MIIEGRNGSLVLFYKDLLICGFPLGSNNYDDYKNQSESLILDSLRKNHSIKKQIDLYKSFIETIYIKKLNQAKISGYDLQVFCASILSLVRFNVFDEDDVIFIADKKRRREKIKKFNQYNSVIS